MYLFVTFCFTKLGKQCLSQAWFFSWSQSLPHSEAYNLLIKHCYQICTWCWVPIPKLRYQYQDWKSQCIPIPAEWIMLLLARQGNSFDSVLLILSSCRNLILGRLHGLSWAEGSCRGLFPATLHRSLQTGWVPATRRHTAHISTTPGQTHCPCWGPGTWNNI